MGEEKKPLGITGKILLLIAAGVGLLTFLLSFILPQYFAWYRIERAVDGTVVFGYYITGFGTLVTVGSPPGEISGLIILEIIGGIALITGAVLCIIGVLLTFFNKEIKTLISVGGILMLVSPLFLIVDVQLISVWVFRDFISDIVGGYTGLSMIWGNVIISPGVILTWSIWIGTFAAFGSGALALIGSSL